MEGTFGMMRILVVLAVTGVLAVGGCGRKNPPVKPVGKIVSTSALIPIDTVAYQ